MYKGLKPLHEIYKMVLSPSSMILITVKKKKNEKTIHICSELPQNKSFIFNTIVIVQWTNRVYKRQPDFYR